MSQIINLNPREDDLSIDAGLIAEPEQPESTIGDRRNDRCLG